MRSVVLGGGEVATAWSLSLLANQRQCAMRLRDRTTCDGMRASNQFAAFQSHSRIDIPRRPALPNATSQQAPLFTVQHWEDDLEAPINAIFVCTPASAFRTEAEGVQRATRRRHSNAVPGADATVPGRTVLNQIDELLLQHHTHLSSLMAHDASDANGPSRATSPAIVVCSRGLAKNGDTPSTRVQRHLEAMKQQGAGPGSVVTAGGSFVAKEWAEHSATAIALASGADAPSVGALSFAASSGATLESRNLLHRMFARESVYWPVSLRGDAVATRFGDQSEAEVLGLANALALLLSFGAGMVSNEYPGSLSATVSYVAHAMTAAEELLARLVLQASEDGDATSHSNRLDALLARNRSAHRGAASSSAPTSTCIVVPPSIASIFVSAIANQSAKEFALGRQLRAQFRHRDALRATFRTQCAHLDALGDTMDGVHARMAAVGAKSPFFESILDAYHTFRRADDVGRQLIHLGGCNTSAEDRRAADPSSLLSKMQALDQAVESGVGFDEAVSNMVAGAQMK